MEGVCGQTLDPEGTVSDGTAQCASTGTVTESCKRLCSPRDPAILLLGMCPEDVCTPVSQQPKSVHRWVSGETKRGPSAQWNITQP